MDQGRLATSLGLLILRAGAGGFMATHGWGKLRMLMDGKGDSFPTLSASATPPA